MFTFNDLTTFGKVVLSGCMLGVLACAISWRVKNRDGGAF